MLWCLIQSIFDHVDVAVTPWYCQRPVPCPRQPAPWGAVYIAAGSVTDSILPDLEFDRSTCRGRPRGIWTVKSNRCQCSFSAAVR